VDSDVEVLYYTHVPQTATEIPNRLADRSNNSLSIAPVSD